MKVVYEALNTNCQGRIIRALLQMAAFKLALPFKCTSISDIFFCLFSIRNLNSSAVNHFKRCQYLKIQRRKKLRAVVVAQ